MVYMDDQYMEGQIAVSLIFNFELWINMHSYKTKIFYCYGSLRIGRTYHQEKIWLPMLQKFQT